jgi:hypothetical protein
MARGALRGGRPHSFAEPQPAVGIEYVQVSGIHPDLDHVPVPGVVPAGPDDDAARRVVGQATVDVGVAAQVLDQRDLDRQLAVADGQVLGPDPDNQLVVALGGAQLGVGRPRWMPSVSAVASNRFMAGEPMNPATNTFAGRS